MAKRQHPELEGYEFQNLYTFELKSQGKKRRDRLAWTLSGVFLGVGLGIGCYIAVPYLIEKSPLTSQSNQPEPSPFQTGTSKAMRAAQETQRAEFKEDWVEVAMLWQGAIDHMGSVPSSDPNYAVAQQKIGEYERNLKYAHSNIETREALNPNADEFWTLGSDRSTLVAIEGTPSRVKRYDALCQEVMYYGNSRVELLHGKVDRYDNVDDNLSVLLTNVNPSNLISEGDRSFWTLGSAREDVFRIEGPPTRISGYESLSKEILDYDDGFIEIENGVVTGYQNNSNSFQVAIAGVTQRSSDARSSNTQSSESDQFWALGTTRDRLLMIQQDTPTQISRDDSRCEEMIYYGTSSVELTHGVVTGYNNVAKNLRVQ